MSNKGTLVSVMLRLHSGLVRLVYMYASMVFFHVKTIDASKSQYLTCLS